MVCPRKRKASIASGTEFTQPNSVRYIPKLGSLQNMGGGDSVQMEAVFLDN